MSQEMMEKGLDLSKRVMDCSSVYTYGIAPGDALSNVLFISVEQSLLVYPEDISQCAILQRFPKTTSCIYASSV